MSKQIKQMQINDLKQRFGNVRDFVLLSVSGLTCQADNQLRLGLRKKNIYLQMVKNSLTRRIFDDAGVKFAAPWQGSTTLAWGAGSIAELCRELEPILKKNDKTIKVKGAVAEGQEVPFAVALKMPTRTEAIGRIIGLALAPAARISAQLKSPGGRIVGQIKAVSEKKPEEEAAPAPAAP